MRQANSFGFKLWCLVSTDGYLIYAEPYCEADTKPSNTGFGQGANVVLGFAEKGGLSTGFFITFDKLFTSFPFLEELSKRGIVGQVTIWQNRLENATVPSKQIKKKTKKGSYDCSIDN